MATTPKNLGKPWSQPENSQLWQLARENTATLIMGIKLGRTEASVGSHAHAQDVSLKSTNQSPYNRQKK